MNACVHYRDLPTVEWTVNEGVHYFPGDSFMPIFPLNHSAKPGAGPPFGRRDPAPMAIAACQLMIMLAATVASSAIALPRAQGAWRFLTPDLAQVISVLGPAIAIAALAMLRQAESAKVRRRDPAELSPRPGPRSALLPTTRSAATRHRYAVACAASWHCSHVAFTGRFLRTARARTTPRLVACQGSSSYRRSSSIT